MKYLHLFRHPSLWSRLLVAAALACALPACVKPEEVNYVQNLVPVSYTHLYSSSP